MESFSAPLIYIGVAGSCAILFGAISLAGAYALTIVTTKSGITRRIYRLLGLAGIASLSIALTVGSVYLLFYLLRFHATVDKDMVAYENLSETVVISTSDIVAVNYRIDPVSRLIFRTPQEGWRLMGEGTHQVGSTPVG